MCDQGIKEVSASYARKRLSNPEAWKSSVNKKRRYSATSLPTHPKCNHYTKSYRCGTLRNEDILKFHKLFYSHVTKIQQDNFLIKYTKVEKPKRKRNSKGGPSRSFSCTYFIRKESTKQLVPVCKKSFIGVLCIGSDRVKGVLNRHFKTSEMASEKRGGDRKRNLFMKKREAITVFIKKFKSIESHYCRSKTACRTYLSSELNIRKMWKMFKNENNNYNIKESYFRFIFNTHFNIGFGSPRTDVCSKCLELSERIKNEKDLTLKNQAIIELRVHKLRAKAFFDKLKEDTEGLLIISFDCQKNLVLPKIPDQSTYYSRQLYMYNFTTVTGNSHARLTKDNVNIFAWTEDQHAKGANEIASCVFFTLNNTNLENINTAFSGRRVRWTEQKYHIVIHVFEVVEFLSNKISENHGIGVSSSWSLLYSS